MMRTLFALLSLPCALAAQLGPATAPPENPTTPAKVMLGKILFWEEQLSSDDAMACGTCHRPEFGGADGRDVVGVHPGFDGVSGTDDDVRGSEGMVRQAANGAFTPDALFGMRQQATERASPTVLGAGHHRALNWDGSVAETFVDPQTGAVVIATGGALEAQALHPILSPVEMANEGRTWADVAAKLATATPLRLARNLPDDVQHALARHADYPALFAAAFGDQRIDARRIAFALASYQRTLNPDDTPWDRYRRGDATALDAQQLAGMRLFEGRAGCAQCHPAPTFTDDRFHALGLRPVHEDPGHGRGAFKTPTLRNAGLRPRLFHDGRSPALSDPAQTTTPGSVTDVFWRGRGRAGGQVSPLLRSMPARGVTREEFADVLVFVRTALTDSRARRRRPPFDHPELRSMYEPPPRLFGEPLAGTSTPFLIDWVPPYPGNAAFKLGLTGSRPGELAMLVIGLLPFDPALVVGPLPFHVQIFAAMPFVLEGAPGQAGHATWFVGLPDHPGLASVPLYYQMFVDDPAAPGGIAASAGTEFFIR